MRISGKLLRNNKVWQQNILFYQHCNSPTSFSRRIFAFQIAKFLTYQFLCKDFGLTLDLICDIVRYPTEKPRPLTESPSPVNYITPQFFENRTIFSVRDASNIKMQFHRIFDTKSYFFWHDFLNILPICVASRHRRKTCHTKKKTARCCLSNEPMYNDVQRKTLCWDSLTFSHF